MHGGLGRTLITLSICTGFGFNMHGFGCQYARGLSVNLRSPFREVRPATPLWLPWHYLSYTPSAKVCKGGGGAAPDQIGEQQD